MQWEQRSKDIFKFSVKFTLLLWITWFARETHAQNLENIQEKKSGTVSGGINLMTTAYAIQGITARRAPFTWIASGNLNFDLYGWNVPLSFSYTNHQGNFQQPFNRYGISPYYKWVKVYLGYNSLTYSSYTLNGHIFLGGGIELTPGNFRLQAMYGRLLKAVEADTLSGRPQPPVYERRGMGIKTGYETGKGSIHAIVFYSKDDPNSITTLPDSSLLFPAENVALSLIAKKQLGGRITWDGEWATTLLTRDVLAPRLADSVRTHFIGGWLMPVRQSTTQHYAWNTGISLALGKGVLEGRYERVDPDYQTLGAYFFNNDLENITLRVGWQFWESRLNVSVQGGVQKNDLDQTELSQTRRWVSNNTISFLPNERLQFTAGYSNFTSFTNIRPQSDPFFTTEFDSLNFYQVNQNGSLTTSYTFGSKDRKSALMLSNTYQQASEVMPQQEAADQTSYNYTNNLSYCMSVVPANLSLSVGGNFYYSVFSDIKTITAGPLVMVGKGFMEKKLRSSLSTGFNQVITNQIATSKVMNTRLSADYSLLKNHRLSLNINLLNSFSTGQKEAFSECTATARYAYTF